MSKIIKGDIVKVISGNYKGKSGCVLSVLGDKISVEGINVRKKAVKKQSPDQEGFIQVFAPIHISNVVLAVKKDDKIVAIKVKKKILKGNKKELGYMSGAKWVKYRSII